MGDIVEELLVFLSMVILAGIFLLPAWWRARDRIRLTQLAATAAERGQPLTAEAIRALPGGRDWRPQTQKDLRRGVMGVATGLCFMLLGVFAWLLIGTFDQRSSVAFGAILAGIGAIPLMHGLALLVLSKVGKDDPM